jgi:hypothetical protein
MTSEPPDHLLAWTRVRGCEDGRVRRLRGFVKGSHREPDGHHPAAEAFVRRAGSAELTERVDLLHRRLRTAFGWKRRELAAQAEGGTGRLETPAFTVNLWLEQSPETARNYRMVTEVARFQTSATLRSEAFAAVFEGFCDVVVIDLPRPLVVPAQIDRLEDSTRLAPLLDYPADGSWLTLRTPGPGALTLRLEAHEISIRFESGGGLALLLEGAWSLLESLAATGALASLEA